MERGSWLLALACILGVSVGCGGSTGEQPVADTSPTAEAPDRADVGGENDDSQEDSLPGPEATVSAFLNAIKSGDQDTANAMLTSLAREKTAEQDMGLAPTESDTATFKIGDVELPPEGDGMLAHVASKWTDIGEDGQPITDEILWALRREKEGWRIGGMATQVFDDQPPVVLDFENPEDMQRKQLMVEHEMERRARAELGGTGSESDQPDRQEPTLSAPQVRETRQHPLR
ncbi:MAG TPA: hypothetical protein VFW87_11400 [Pirellulales bacterium]|nr:hypothetical protein [Pirellulales bacterium]